ncbi:MAG: monovalent cation/H+ antiporter subunit D family protein, partial [Hyphomicrobiales bacterium]|nr:monovalent cation/H+ antiporter subunit D family protein [Hyphomicrobiales bacterium]
AFAIGSLSIIGLPPLAGLWSKWYLAIGALDAGQLGIIAVLMASSLLNIAYLLPIPLRAFLAKPANGKTEAGLQEAPLPCLVAIGITSALCLILFFFPGPLFELTRMIPLR